MTFYDPIESTFYSWCVERLLASAELDRYTAGGVVELGAGSGIPLLEAVSRAETTTRIRGFERDPEAFRTARRLVELKGPANYTVELADFFEYAETADERCVIANPPYLPGSDLPGSDLPGSDGAGRGGLRTLCGGERGAQVTRRLLDGPFDLALLMVASISDPLGVLEEASRRGYRVLDWSVRPITFGRYSREPAVWEQIRAQAEDGRAFFAPDGYLLAGVTWIRDGGSPAAGTDPDALARVLTVGAGTAGS
jgi:hypothetical protein